MLNFISIWATQYKVDAKRKFALDDYWLRNEQHGCVTPPFFNYPGLFLLRTWIFFAASNLTVHFSNGKTCWLPRRPRLEILQWETGKLEILQQQQLFFSFHESCPSKFGPSAVVWARFRTGDAQMFYFARNFHLED